MNRHDHDRTKVMTKILAALGAQDQYVINDPKCGINLWNDSTIIITRKIVEIIGDQAQPYYYHTTISVATSQERTRD